MVNQDWGECHGAILVKVTLSTLNEQKITFKSPRQFSEVGSDATICPSYYNPSYCYKVIPSLSISEVFVCNSLKNMRVLKWIFVPEHTWISVITGENCLRCSSFMPCCHFTIIPIPDLHVHRCCYLLGYSAGSVACPYSLSSVRVSSYFIIEGSFTESPPWKSKRRIKQTV